MKNPILINRVGLVLVLQDTMNAVKINTNHTVSAPVMPNQTLHLHDKVTLI